MISSKVVLTYKRKRPASKFEVAHEIKVTRVPSEPSILTISTQKDDSSSEHFSGEQKIDDEDVKCLACDIGGNLLACDGCSQTYHPRRMDPPLQHFYHGKWLCTACSERNGSGESLQHRVRKRRRIRVKNCIEGSQMGPMTLRSRKVLSMKHHSENTSTEEKDFSHQGADFEKESSFAQLNVYSHIGSGAMCELAKVGRNTGSHLTDMDIAKASNPVFLDSSKEETSLHGCQDASLSKIFPSENSDSPNQRRSNLSHSDVVSKNLSCPLITFSRRGKRKDHVKLRDTKNLIEQSNYSAAKSSRCQMGVRSLDEEASQKCNPERSTTAILQGGRDTSLLSVQRQYESENKEVGVSEPSPTGGALENKNFDSVHSHTGQEQSIQQSILEGSSAAECVTKFNINESLSGMQPNPAGMVLKDCCAIRSIEMLGAKKDVESISGSISAVGKTSATVLAGAAEISNVIARSDDVSEDGGLMTHLKLSVALPGAISPDNWLSSHKVQNSRPISEPSFTYVSETIRCSANSSITHHANASCEGSIERCKGLQFLEVLDEQTKEIPSYQRQNDEKRYSFIDEDGISCKRAYDGKASPWLMNTCQQGVSGDILKQVLPLACISQDATTCLDIQGRTSLPQPDFENNPYTKSTKSSLLSSNFLGLSLPAKAGPSVGSVKDLGSIDQQLAWQDVLQPSTSHETSSSLRHRQLLDNIISRAGMLRGSQGRYPEKMKGFANNWSEEELDCLWIGVRRHGRDNWDAMLRDPKLHFSGWRVAEDLAKRWDEEQAKLFNGSPFHSVRVSRADLCPFISDGLVAKAAVGNHGSSYGTEHRVPPGYQTLTTETQLSLGDVYGYKEENIRKRHPPGPPHLSAPRSAVAMPENDIADVDSAHLIDNPNKNSIQKMGPKQHKLIKSQRSYSHPDSKRVRYDSGLSILPQKPVDISSSHPSGGMFGYGKNKATPNESVSTDELPAGLPTKDNLPHWLREVLSVSSKPSESTLPANVSAVAHSVSVLYNDSQVVPPFSDLGMPLVPPKDPRQRPRNNSRITSKVGALRVSASLATSAAGFTSSPWMETRFSLLPALDSSTLKHAPENRVSDHKTTDIYLTSSDVFRPNDLIVIDSEASSEETISDDQSVRH